MYFHHEVAPKVIARVGHAITNTIATAIPAIIAAPPPPPLASRNQATGEYEAVPPAATPSTGGGRSDSLLGLTCVAALYRVPSRFSLQRPKRVGVRIGAWDLSRTCCRRTSVRHLLLAPEWAIPQESVSRDICYGGGIASLLAG